MAHPYHLHREHQVSHRRVAPLLKEEPAGAKQHATGNPFSKVTSKSAAMGHDDVAGRAGPKRFARGGKVKKHGHQTNIAIVVPGGGKGAPPPAGGPPPGGPPMGGAPPMPPHPPMMPPPGAGAGGPPMGGPPGMPPGMPMRARGGKVKKMTGGALTGVGRLEKEDAMEKKRK